MLSLPLKITGPNSMGISHNAWPNLHYAYNTYPVSDNNKTNSISVNGLGKLHSRTCIGFHTNPLTDTNTVEIYLIRPRILVAAIIFLPVKYTNNPLTDYLYKQTLCRELHKISVHGVNNRETCKTTYNTYKSPINSVHGFIIKYTYIEQVILHKSDNAHIKHIQYTETIYPSTDIYLQKY